MADTSNTKSEEPVQETSQPESIAKKKKMPKILKIILIGIAGFIALVVTLVIIFITASKGATKASDEFLNAVQAGDSTTAYQLFSSDAKAEVPEDQFIEVVSRVGPILNSEERKTSTNISAESGSDTEATVVYEIDGNDGATYGFAVSMVKEDGEWKVLNFDSEAKQ